MVGLTPRRQAAGRSAERAHAPIASQPTPYALPSWSQKTWLALARLRRETRPGELLLALRRRWHEGTADTTLLPSLRGWVSALLPGQSHNTHCPFGHSCLIPTFILFVPTAPRSRDPSARNKRSDNVALCAIPPLHWHADCDSAPSRSCGQSSRQLAGIPHANAAAPRVFLNLAGSGDGKLTSELVCSRCSIDRVFPNPFFLSSVSCLSPSLRHRKTSPPFVAPSKAHFHREGWRLRFLVKGERRQTRVSSVKKRL